MYLGPVLEAVKLRIIDTVNKSWDSNWLGESTTYTLTPALKYSRLTITTLSYPVTSKWVFFNSTIEIKDIAQAVREFSLKNTKPINISGTAEGGYDYCLAKAKLFESIQLTIKLARDNGVAVRIATATGLESNHFYVEFDKEHNEMVQKLVFIMVIKNTKK